MPKRGYKPSIIESLHGNCCECTGNYADGRVDCQRVQCPAYCKHKYRKLTPSFDWIFGEWSNHNKQRMALGQTREQYIANVIGTVKYKIGITSIFRAICFKCNGEFKGGVTREDCGIPNCPLYYWMPYRDDLPSYDWMFDLDYTDRHRVNATVEGYLIPNQSNMIIFDRQRYISDKLNWTGDPPPQQARSKRVRVIA